MEEIRIFVKKEVRQFVKSQRVRAGIRPTSIFFGYVIEDVESRAEQIPICDLYRILGKLCSENELIQWHFDFQMKVYDLKKKNIWMNS